MSDAPDAVRGVFGMLLMNPWVTFPGLLLAGLGGWAAGARLLRARTWVLGLLGGLGVAVLAFFLGALSIPLVAPMESEYTSGTAFLGDFLRLLSLGLAWPLMTAFAACAGIGARCLAGGRAASGGKP